eukprot:170316_1
MNNNELEFAINRLKREKVELERHKRDGLVLVGVAGEPLEQNIAEWHINIKPNNGVYKDICFHLIMTFPATYPVNPPEIHMCTPIQHPNIFQDHSLCMPMFRNNVNNHPYGGWSCGYTITSILMQLQTFLSNDNPNSNLVDNNIKQILESTKKFKCKCGHSYYTPKPLIIDPQFKITYNPYDIYKHIKQIKIKNTETGSTLSIKDLKQHLYVNSSNQLQFIQGQDKKLLILIEFNDFMDLHTLTIIASDKCTTNHRSGPKDVTIHKIDNLQINLQHILSLKKKIKCSVNELDEALHITCNDAVGIKFLAIHITSNRNNTNFTFFNDICFLGYVNLREQQTKMAEKRKNIEYEKMDEKRNDNEMKENDDNKQNEHNNYKTLDAFTIDPDEAMRYDDAVSIHVEKINNKNVFVLGIHIADVTHYISAQDEKKYEEKKRQLIRDLEQILELDGSLRVNPTLFGAKDGCLTYQCSLIAGLDRKAISLFIYMDSEGNLVKTPKFIKTEINSLITLTFDEADKWYNKNAQSGYMGQQFQFMVMMANKMLMQNYQTIGTRAYLKNKSVSKDFIEYLMILYNEMANDLIKQKTNQAYEDKYTSPMRKRDDRTAQRNLKKYI